MPPQELRLSPHKFSGVFAGSVQGRDSLWTHDTHDRSEIHRVLSENFDVEEDPKPVSVIVDDGRSCTVYREWSPRKCPLAAGILSGLYHFPVSSGDVVFVTEVSCETLIHLATLVGPTGQVRALCLTGASNEAHMSVFMKRFPNVWIHVSDAPYDPEADRAIAQRLSRTLVCGVYSERAGSPLACLKSCREAFITSVKSFLGAFPESPPASAALFLFPPGLPALSPDAITAYGDYLSRSLPGLCASAPSVWLLLALPVQPALARLEEAVDFCCERIFDLLATSVAATGSVRPKEQLRVDPQFAHDTVLLVSRFKRGSRTVSPMPLSEEALLVQAFASLANQTDQPETIPSILSELLGVTVPATPRPHLDPQLLFDLQQAKQGNRLTLSDLVGPEH